MPRTHDIAPRITLYPSDSAPPALQPGWISLAQLPPVTGAPTVFGDGSHPTTRLCAIAVDALCRQRQPKAILDVGTGAGVLARVARARGASFVVGTDIDPDALSCARSQAALDDHPVALELSAEAPDYWGPLFDLVVANILEAPLRSLAPALLRALAPEGLLLLSGFMRPQAPALRFLYESGGLVLRGQSSLEEWVLLTFEHALIGGQGNP